MGVGEGRKRWNDRWRICGRFLQSLFGVMRSLWAYARHWIFQIYLWAVLNEAIPGESTGLYTPAEGLRLRVKMFHFNRGDSSTKAELNSMALVSTPPLPWQRLFPPAIIIHNFILSFLFFLILYSGDDNQWKALILFSSIIWVSGLWALECTFSNRYERPKCAPEATSSKL